MIFGIFSGMKEQKVTTRNDYIPDGDHTLEILNCKQSTAFEGYNFIAAEMKVLDTTSDKIKVGQVVSLFIKMQPGRPWQSNLKAFLGAAMGYADPNEVDETDCEAAVSAENPLAGIKVLCSGRPRAGKKDPTKVYTNYSWRSIGGAS